MELPTRGEVQFEGLNPDIETYRKVVHKVARNFFQAAGLTLWPLDDDLFQVAPSPGNEWPDAAYYLAHLGNLEASAVVINSAQELLKRNAPKGEPWPDYEQAVLANLDILREAPAALKISSARDALIKSFELIKKGPEAMAAELDKEYGGE
ncbi:MAG: hypothetical protein KMY53_00230 [Desulfarculus sp.]|nr:hypothetical protein [Pseudomonadota bacterium]MBV1716987.1 hypothetical protein [Desulfarculus sp.]MBU4575870.1 hypothetical protein [Pseudomonadota bacterium]MBU4597610.1 hypothetical protein [Pseudomonadota bacterium]MBV1736563.1 hypothetical protein [Desulfarculus sp.]